MDRQEAIRSRTPQGVRQEFWGILLAYNLVRVEMERAADEAGVEPTRISFVNALSLIRTGCSTCAGIWDCCCCRSDAASGATHESSRSR